MEQDLSRLIKMEVETHCEQENLKQIFESMPDWTPQLAYKAVDATNIGFIDMKALETFFRRHFVKGLGLEDHAAVIRRLDLDADGRLRPEEFLKGIAA